MDHRQGVDVCRRFEARARDYLLTGRGWVSLIRVHTRLERS